MTAHPYPQKIRQAVANEVCLQILGKPLVKTGDQTRHAFLTDADQILTALWEASRIDYGDLQDLPDDAVIQTAQGQTLFVSFLKHLHSIDDYPAAVIHWGDPHESA